MTEWRSYRIPQNVLNARELKQNLLARLEIWRVEMNKNRNLVKKYLENRNKEKASK